MKPRTKPVRGGWSGGPPKEAAGLWFLISASAVSVAAVALYVVLALGR